MTAAVPGGFPFLVRELRSMRDHERQVWQLRQEGTVEFQTLNRNLTFDDSGVVALPSVSIDHTKIPKYPLMATIHEQVPRATLHRLLYYCADASRPLPHGKSASEDVLNATRAVYAATDPATDLLHVQFETSTTGNIGRWYATYDKFCTHVGVGKLVGSSLGIPKYLRTTMWAKHNFVDLDQRKSHPTILLSIGKLFGVATPALAEYLEHTDACLDLLAHHWTADASSPITRTDAKRLINRTVYGGGLRGWLDELRSGASDDTLRGVPTYSGVSKPIRDVAPHDLYTAIRNECTLIMDLIYDKNQPLLMALCAHPSLEEHQKKRKLLSFFCQCIEHHITYTALEFCLEHGAFRTTATGEPIVVWGYDGLSWVPPRGLIVEALTEELNTHLHTVLGPAFGSVEFVLKPHNPADCIPTVLADEDPLWRSRDYACDFDPLSEFTNPHKVSREDELAYWQSKPYAEWKVWFEESHFKVEDPTQWGWATYNTTGGLLNVTWYSVETLRVKYWNTHCMALDNKGKLKVMQAIPKWLLDPRMRVYRNIDNYPRPLVCPKSTFNTWTESPYHYTTPSTDPTIDQAYVDLFLWLQSVVCGRDPTSEAYFTYWNADWVQRPATKSGVIPIIVGTEGTGKTLYAQFLLKIAGVARSLETNIENVVNTFNSLLEGKLLVVLNELNGGLDSAQNAIFKQLLTDGNVTINGKGRPQYTVKSYHRFLGTSNFPNVMDSDRRPFYVKSNYDLLLPENYDRLMELVSMTTNEKALGAIYRYFLNLDMQERFGTTHLTPPNNALNREFKRNRQPYAQFAWHLVDMYIKPGVIGPVSFAFSTLELHDLFHAWLVEQKIVAPVASYGCVMTNFVGSISWPAGCIMNPTQRHGVSKRLFNFLAIKTALEILYPRDPNEVWHAARIPNGVPTLGTPYTEVVEL